MRDAPNTNSAFRLALEISARLRRSGHRCLLVGGCVRDRLLGITPKDYDLATSALSDQILQYFPHALLVGAHFGVTLISDSAGNQVEVATFRSEGQYSDGRHPDSVKFVTEPAADARRRDFTINGLFEDPLSGEIFDFVGGKDDLQARRIRAIGDPLRRFQEDHLRMLRAVRFAARLQFTIDPPTLSAIQQEAHQISRISPERIRNEIEHILTQANAHTGIELLDQTGLLTQILPQVKAFQGVQQPPEFHPEGDVWTHVLLMLQNLRNPTLTLALGVLLHDLGKPATFRIADRIRFDGHAEVGAKMAREILTHLKFSNDDIEQTVSLVANHMKFKDVQQMRLSTLKRFLRLPQFDQHLELHRLDCLASNGRTQAYNFVVEQLAAIGEEQLNPPRLISGADLIKAGFQPGPQFKEALELVASAQLEGDVSTHEDAMKLAVRVLGRK